MLQVLSDLNMPIETKPTARWIDDGKQSLADHGRRL